jgi:hypothetical protein
MRDSPGLLDLSVGKIVHIVGVSGATQGVHLPAIVVRIIDGQLKRVILTTFDEGERGSYTVLRWTWQDARFSPGRGRVLYRPAPAGAFSTGPLSARRRRDCAACLRDPVARRSSRDMTD